MSRYLACVWRVLAVFLIGCWKVFIPMLLRSNSDPLIFPTQISSLALGPSLFLLRSDPPQCSYVHTSSTSTVIILLFLRSFSFLRSCPPQCSFVHTFMFAPPQWSFYFSYAASLSFAVVLRNALSYTPSCLHLHSDPLTFPTQLLFPTHYSSAILLRTHLHDCTSTVILLVFLRSFSFLRSGPPQCSYLHTFMFAPPQWSS